MPRTRRLKLPARSSGLLTEVSSSGRCARRWLGATGTEVTRLVRPDAGQDLIVTRRDARRGGCEDLQTRSTPVVGSWHRDQPATTCAVLARAPERFINGADDSRGCSPALRMGQPAIRRCHGGTAAQSSLQDWPGRAGPAGTSACRPRARWTIARAPRSATVLRRQPRRGRPTLEITAERANAAVRQRRTSSRLTGADFAAKLDARTTPPGADQHCCRADAHHGPGHAALGAAGADPVWLGGLGRTAYLGSAQHLHAGAVRRPRGAGTGGGRCAAPSGVRRQRAHAPLCARKLCPRSTQQTGRCASFTARTARLTSSRADDIATLLSRQTCAGALQFQPHRRAPHRPQARNGRGADGGEAGLHPSNIHDNRLCGRRDRLHRRHADHPRARWA